MKELREEYAAIVESLEGDIPGRNAAVDYVNHSDIYAHGTPVPFSYIPNLVDASDIDFLTGVCKTTHTILCKVIKRYLEDEDYRSLFGYPSELDRLMLLPCDFDELLPLARFDIFLNEETREFKFCEFNTDGSGAMSRDFELGHALELGESYAKFSERHDVGQFELFDSWVRAFMENYRQCPYAKEVPTIAVTDFEESGVFSDFNRFIEAFKRAGYPARFVDVRSFSFDGEKLIDPSDGTQIDAIYRRSVTSEILQHPGECEDLISAVEARKVCIIGHFRNTVVHSKVINIALFDERTRAFLTEDECAFIDAHVPHTYRLTKDCAVPIEHITASKDAWILKPEDDYGSHGVYCGVEMSESEWACAVETCVESGHYIVQEYYLPHKALSVRAEPVDGVYEPVKQWEYMPGMYVYNGQFVGMYCRHGEGGVIALDHGGLCSNTFRVA